MTSRVLANLPKAAGAEIRFRIVRQGDGAWLDIRVFKQTHGEGSDWIHTKEGFAIPLSKLEVLRDTILQVEAAALTANRHARSAQSNEGGRP